MKTTLNTALTVTTPKFAAPTPRDLRFERTQPADLRRVPFALDEQRLVASVTDGVSIVVCLIAALALLGLVS